MRIKSLPEALKNMSPTEKLVWFFIWNNGEDSYTLHGSAGALGLHHPNVSDALTALVQRGLILETKPATRGRNGAGRYQATDAPIEQGKDDEQSIDASV